MRPRAAGYAVFGGALLLALLVGHLLRESPGYATRNPDGSLSGDLQHYVYWTRLVTLGGVQAAYGGKWPETYAVYPPVTLYGYQVVGSAYRALQDPAFDPDRAQASLWLRAGIKGVAMGWHLLAGLAIYLLVRRAHGPTLAGLAGAAYVANPAALFDVAHWGQPDGAHSLFAVLGIGAMTAGLDVLAWSALVVAALAKPQAWSLLPLALIGSVRAWSPAAFRRQTSILHGGSDAADGGRSGRHAAGDSVDGVRGGGNGPPAGHQGGGLHPLVRRLALDAAAALLTALVVVSPFLASGHLRELLTLPGTITSVMPVASADAHNLWWLVLGPDAIFTFDSERWLGPLSFRALAGLLVLAELGLTCWLYWTRRASLAEAAALGALGWFVFTTQAHENHLFFVLPLLALAWPDRRGLLVVFAALSLTLLLNMVLHDQLVLEALGTNLEDRGVRLLRLANAALNVGCCAAWTAWAALRPAGAAAPRERASAIVAVQEGEALHA